MGHPDPQQYTCHGQAVPSAAGGALQAERLSRSLAASHAPLLASLSSADRTRRLEPNQIPAIWTLHVPGGHCEEGWGPLCGDPGHLCRRSRLGAGPPAARASAFLGSQLSFR